MDRHIKFDMWKLHLWIKYYPWNTITQIDVITKQKKCNANLEEKKIN